MVAGVGHYAGPGDGDVFACAERVLDGDFDVRKRAAKAVEERDEGSRAVDYDAGLILANADDIFVEQVVDGLDASLVPSFLEPAPHQGDVFFDGHAAPLLRAIELRHGTKIPSVCEAKNACCGTAFEFKGRSG